MAKNTNKEIFRYEQEKSSFIEALRNFHYNRGTSFHHTPRCGNKDVDLYQLYQRVTSNGGWKKVTEEKLWGEVLADLKLPQACINADQALKHIYIRYLNIYEQINFLGEDPKLVDARRDDEGPIRKKHCGPQYNVPLSYNYGQHDVAVNLREGFGLCTTYAKFSDYEKLEKSLVSGLPNEVDFVINVCTLLSNESKHTLRLDRCSNLTGLLLAHIGIFNDGVGSLEKLYENCWRKNTDRDFIRFWFDTVKDADARERISFTREDKRSLCGSEVLQLGRNLGVEDKEGMRVTQVAIIIRNLSFDAINMKVLANDDLLALDTVGNLSGQFVLEPSDSFKSETILDLIIKCITSEDKFAVVTGLEMVSKLSQTEDNEYVISEKLDVSLYEEISKYLTIADIQLIVYSLEALYQLSEIGEETNSKIAETSNTVEYCPPPHVSGAVEGATGAVGASGQPPGQATPQKKTDEKGAPPEPPVPPSPIEITTCNWLQATYEAKGPTEVVSHLGLYTDYLAFCSKFQLTQPLSSNEFLKTIQMVYPRSASAVVKKPDGGEEMGIHGLKKRPAQLPFSIATAAPVPATPSSIAPSSIRHPGAPISSPALARRLAGPAMRPMTPVNTVMLPITAATKNTPIFSPGSSSSQQSQAQSQMQAQTSIPASITAVAGAQPIVVSQQVAGTTVAMATMSSGQVLQVSTTAPFTNMASQQVFTSGTVTIPQATMSSVIPIQQQTQPLAVAAQGFANDPLPPPTNTINSKTKTAMKRKIGAKKNAQVLPKAEPGPNNLPAIVPKVLPTQTSQQINLAQPQLLANQQIITQDGVVYQAVQDQQNPDNKVFVKALLTPKIHRGNVIIQQPVQGVMNIQNLDFGASGDGQTVQFQTSFPQAFPQQTTYIQYASPASSTQTIIQPSQPASNVQTYIVQPNGEMYMQGQTPATAMATQMVVTPGQPQIIGQQSIMVPQQQIMVSQQPGIPQQQMFMSQHQIIGQSQMIQQPQIVPTSQFISQHQTVVSGQQIMVQAQPSQPSLQATSNLSLSHSTSLSSSVSSVTSSTATLDTSSSMSLMKSNSTDSNTSASQNVLHSNVDKSSSDTSNQMDNFQSDIGQVRTDTSARTDGSEPLNPSNSVSNSNISASVPDSSVEQINNNVGRRANVAEIESAVGSIMEDSNDSQDNAPVMIENDGNELMFEQQNYHMCADSGASTAEVFAGDAEAAMAVEQLEHMDDQTEQVEQNAGVVIISNENGDGEDMDGIDSAVIPDDGIVNENALPNGDVEMCDGRYKEGSVEKEAVVSDEELIAKFRAETPINVPIVSENGLYEQDFEARLAVEGLLKDVCVEFNVNDEDNGGVNVVYSNPDSAPDSVKTASSKQEGETAVADESNGGDIESQTNGEPTVETAKKNTAQKSANSVDHSKVNGIDSNSGKHLMNGDLSSPECQSVPSPTGVVNGGEKLVNGITDEKTVDKMMKMNGVVNHKISNSVQESKDTIVCENTDTESGKLKMDDILAQSLEESHIVKSDEDSNFGKIEEKPASDDGDILARSILENGIDFGDCEMGEPEPTGVATVVKQMIPTTMYGNITVQFSNNTIPITFSSNAIITSKANQINVCSSRHIPTPESARDGELSCDSTSSSIATTELSVSVSDKHSNSKIAQSKAGHKETKKSQASPKGGETKKKSSSKKRSRSKSGGSASSDSRPNSTASPGVAAAPLPEYLCEWAGCRKCFDNGKKVFNHVCNVHLRTEYDGLCKWEGCESLVRKRWSLFTHVQDHHCSESSLKVAAQRRLQSFQTGQKISAPTIPAMVYPKDAANQAIKRFLPKPPYPEFTEGREGPVTKHIRLTSALILRNLARYSQEGRRWQTMNLYEMIENEIFLGYLSLHGHIVISQNNIDVNVVVYEISISYIFIY
ncbi:ARID2-like protein [Mya arenaria]|uniref:ARID2-like protein n=1 Tax=Mya arenaria TaxID=6604 RepID=A0ABY7EJE0_MYAAR|nr:ARID2-like protein [Mya arenaria]